VGLTTFWRMRQSSLYEYFYYFLALSLLVALTIGGALYYSSSSMLWNDAVRNNSNTLQLLKNGQEIVLSEVDKAMENVFLDSSFQNYMDYLDRSDIFMQMQLQKRLDNVVLASDYIHSVTIYYDGPKYVLSSRQGAVPLDDFQDRKFIETLSTTPIDKSYVRTRSLEGISSTQSETVISIIKTLPIIYAGKPSAFVVINIKGDYLAKIMNSLNTNKDAHIIVADRQGHIISQKTPSDMQESGSTPGEFDIRPLQGASGSLFLKLNGVETLVCYVTSEPSGWLYVYTVPKETITQGLRIWGNATITICVIAVLLSLVGSMFLSRRIFSPLQRMMLLLKGVDTAPERRSTREGTEMRQIEQNVSRLIDQNRDLTNLLQDYEVQSRAKFLLQLTEGSEQVTAQTVERLRYYGVQVGDEGYFVVGIVSIDDFTSFRQERGEAQRNAFLLELSELLYQETYIKEGFQGYLVETETNEMALVLYVQDVQDEPDAAETVRARLYPWFRQLHTMLSGISTITFTLGVSGPHYGLSELNQGYREAESAVRHRLVNGYNNVIFYESEKTDQSIAPYPLGIEKHLLNHFKTGNHAEVASSLREFEDYVLDHHSGQIEVVRHYFLHLFSASLRCMYEIDANLGFQPLIRQLKATDLLELETLQSLVQYMQALFDQVLEYLDDKRGMKNKELCAAITGYIAENLGEDLSIERLSERFSISVSHLRKIFKVETGSTIKDMISEQRIAKAKELLGNPENRIADIALQVGYLSVQSFTRAFKLETGKTPGELREQSLREK
jgi:AraC-like DNA-binding protein